MGMCTTCFARLPSRAITHGSPPRMKAMCVPAGDQEGTLAFRASKRSPLPSGFIRQRSRPLA